MGLTRSSVSNGAIDCSLEIKKKNLNDKIIALAGNPNVGKSTVFNNLTNMNQHTGNWPGKTIVSAQGYLKSKNHSYVLVDIPGTYSLMSHSQEEEVARNFICFSKPDTVVVVCDATCLERNLNLVLQIMEITSNVIVCVNLMDEAKRKNITIDIDLLSRKLGVPVVATTARNKKSLDMLVKTIDDTVEDNCIKNSYKILYNDTIEEAIKIVDEKLKMLGREDINSRWVAIRLLDNDEDMIREIDSFFDGKITQNKDINEAILKAKVFLEKNNINLGEFKDKIVESIINSCEEITDGVVKYESDSYNSFDFKIDRVLTGKWGAYPVMILLLALIFWITIMGANYPSEIISNLLFSFGDKLLDLFNYFNAPQWLSGAVVLGVYKVLSWVVSVMLPPMAIFFPLFTLLEDVGYLPRIAYNLDKPFKKCRACGKQALTMCMGFGCNACGVVGCRIIDSPRERLLAILTNNFIPCNGRFPILITMITMFFVGSGGGFLNGIMSALILTVLILLGIGITFCTTYFLSKTLLKGIQTSFTLELPSYRRPQITKVIVRSIFDRTIFVLSRAMVVAAPAGLIIWLMANINIGNISVLNYCANFLDPFAKIMGMDGIILMAFILGFPANEIVIPIIIMAYMATGSLVSMDSIIKMRELFILNGWTVKTAVSVMLFSLMHWPCSTTVLTIMKETKSIKWTAVAVLLPTIIGVIACVINNFVFGIFV